MPYLFFLKYLLYFNIFQLKVLTLCRYTYKSVHKKDNYINFIFDNQITYKDSYNNGYEYINLNKEFKNFNVNIRTEPEKDIIKEYGFYKFLYWIS